MWQCRNETQNTCMDIRVLAPTYCRERFNRLLFLYHSAVTLSGLLNGYSIYATETSSDFLVA
jgi:hypothetical protein